MPSVRTGKGRLDSPATSARVEVITAEKRRIVAAELQSGADESTVTREASIRAIQLFWWRSSCRLRRAALPLRRQ